MLKLKRFSNAYRCRSSQDQGYYLTGVGAWADDVSCHAATDTLEHDLMLLEAKDQQKRKGNTQSQKKKHEGEKGVRGKNTEGPNHKRM